MKGVPAITLGDSLRLRLEGDRGGCTVWVKHENHTPTGAFKVRGGLVYVDRLTQSQPGIAGVVSATRGNHGQSISFATARARIPATLYVPYGNSPDQNASMASFGARVVEFGKDFDEAKHEAHRVATAEGLHFVPSFHWDLVAGVASYALELFRAVERLDAVYVGVGMGSGICGVTRRAAAGERAHGTQKCGGDSERRQHRARAIFRDSGRSHARSGCPLTDWLSSPGFLPDEWPLS